MFLQLFERCSIQDVNKLEDDDILERYAFMTIANFITYVECIKKGISLFILLSFKSCIHGDTKNVSSSTGW